jgi:hypothetical protein
MKNGELVADRYAGMSYFMMTAGMLRKCLKSGEIVA